MKRRIKTRQGEKYKIKECRKEKLIGKKPIMRVDGKKEKDRQGEKYEDEGRKEWRREKPIGEKPSIRIDGEEEKRVEKRQKGNEGL